MTVDRSVREASWKIAMEGKSCIVCVHHCSSMVVAFSLGSGILRFR